MNDSTIFNAYRYLIKISDDNYHMYHYIDPYPINKKEKLIHDFLEKLKKGIKHQFIYFNKKYLIYYISDISDQYFLLKLAKEKELELYVEGDRDLEEINTNNFPPVYVIADKTNQVLLIQHESQVFQNTIIAANALRTCFNEFALQYHYEISIESINDSDSFWSMVDTYPVIKLINFRFHSPNFFEGIIEFNKIAKLMKEKYNNTLTHLILKNDNDKLNIDKTQEEINEMLEYIDGGGGSWSAIVIEKDKKVTKQSCEYSKKVFIEGDLPNIFSYKSDIIEEKMKVVAKIVKNG